LPITRRGGNDSPEAIAAYEESFVKLVREKCRLAGLRVVAAYLDSPEAMQEKPRAVEGIASGTHHPQPGMHCAWCQFKTECMAWSGQAGIQQCRAA
jgi:hypothetical protein